MRNASTAPEATQIAKRAERVSTSFDCFESTSSATGASVRATCSGAMSKIASMIESERSAPTRMPVRVAAKIRNGKSESRHENAM